MSWINKTFGSKKPIIAMCHMPPLPGDIKFNLQDGIGYVIEQLKEDLHILQNNGANAILFSNEFSMPYMLKADMITVAAMARIIGELVAEINVPFGIDYMFDIKASIDLACATEANFIRGVISGIYASDFGLWNTNAGEIERYIYSRRMDNRIGVFYSIAPQGATSLDSRNKIDIINSTNFHMNPDAICIPVVLFEQLILEGKLENILQNKNYALIIDGGCNSNNIMQLLEQSDGAIIGTALKNDGKFTNRVDALRVKQLMEKINNSMR